MKFNLLLTALLVSCQLFSFGQDSKIDYNRVGQYDFEYKICPFDTIAEAVVFFDLGKSRFEQSESGFELVFERKTRIKVLKEAGRKFAEIEIPLYRQGNIFEVVYDIEAYVFNFVNGELKKSQLDTKNSHDEKVNESWIIKKIVLPDVRVGSVIEYQYKLRSEYLFNLRDWNFQWEIPVIYSEYEVKMIPFYQYTFLLQGITQFDVQTSMIDEGFEDTFAGVKFKNMVHTYGMKNLPGFKVEEFISSKDDYLIKMDFQLSRVIQTNGVGKDIISTWPLLIKELIEHENFGAYVKKTKNYTNKIININSLSAKSSLEKFDYIVNYVKSNFHWNNRISKYASKPLKNLLKDKFGNSADLNLLTIGMLNSVGVNAYPLIISTRDNGKVKSDYPFLSFFNNVIIYADIDGKKILSDATEPLLANDKIPSNYINDDGLIIQKDKLEWLSLQSKVPSKIRNTFNITLTESGLNADITTYASEYNGLLYRKKFGDDKKSLNKNLIENGYDIVDSTIMVKNLKDKNKPYILNYSIKENLERINDKIYILPFFHEVINDNPLKLKSRTYPIDMTYPNYKSFYSEIKIPEGYEVDFLPANAKILNDQFELNYLVSNNEEKGSVTVSYNYYFKQSVYPDTEYSKLKFYFNEIVNKGVEKIVLSKKL
jgi:hypothetical protein